jgi:hypothetical protein
MTDSNSSIQPPSESGQESREEPSCSLKESEPEKGGANSPKEVLTGMTLEQIIDITGEFTHLNELVMIHIEKSGGFTGPDSYFKTVQPLLDLLEVEIRIRFRPGMTQQEMKLVVQDWIDQEIRDCGNKNSGAGV